MKITGLLSESRHRAVICPLGYVMQFWSCYAVKEIFIRDNETVKDIEGYTNEMPYTVCMKTKCDPERDCVNHNIFASLGSLLLHFIRWFNTR